MDVVINPTTNEQPPPQKKTLYFDQRDIRRLKDIRTHDKFYFPVIQVDGALRMLRQGRKRSFKTKSAACEYAQRFVGRYNLVFG